ncbi:lipopolysaccharide transport periplasmic protein LptA [Marinobacter bryozoorum]|uniref:lipopolysaccharide transport periplasmic protein LptA n=1 Tax=Marinobacter bryozoorum TaxID=256324 RepID=UPI002005DEE9|nr:lipopolysaccharide transport periplasmic protein LptA [Marinobacter bryozoorum]MCK7546108.1 lipopolysaccharide transport periplasmic protein LptA [Marinobacter bryozoorum]
MKSVSNPLRYALLLLALAPALPAAAFDMNSGAPIRITADSARLDESQGSAIYRGNVDVRQGEVLLTADRVEVYRGSEGLDRIHARGQPATYDRPATASEGAVHAEALEIRYSASENLLRFEQQATVKQGEDEFRGAIITYDAANRIVTGEGRTGDGEGSGRVEMVIQPRGNNSPSGN